MSRILIVIPARFASTRLPGKMLLSETGTPLILHTVDAARQVPGADILVATDDQRILDAVNAHGSQAVMTDPGHKSGTDRVAEAAEGRDADIIVNLQGDEPEIDPGHIQSLANTHARAVAASPDVFASTLVCPFPDNADATAASAVKAVLSQPLEHDVRYALYFSRSLVPFPRQPGADPLLHIGIYAFSPHTLRTFPTLAATPLEGTEGLEQLRMLEHGHRIAAGMVESAAPGIDTPEDYAAFVERWRRRQQSPAGR